MTPKRNPMIKLSVQMAKLYTAKTATMTKIRLQSRIEYLRRRTILRKKEIPFKKNGKRLFQTLMTCLLSVLICCGAS
jgi:hypothetical protein